MNQRGIRGAITVLADTDKEISSSVCELLNEMISQNAVLTKDISHVIFSMTQDLKSMYPAKAARDNIKGFNTVPMFCVGEQNIQNSLKMCLRVLMVVNTDKDQEEIKHIYLRDARKLREDLANG